MSDCQAYREAQVAALRRQLEGLERPQPLEDDQPVSTGVGALDRLLPARGMWRGSLVDYLSPGSGSGTLALALAAASAAGGPDRALVVLDRQRRFYPLAARAWGIDLSRLLLIRPDNETDALWALDQALRCPGVGGVLAAWDQPMDVRDFRRLQLAAECGGTIGVLLRPARQRGQPTWSDVQWAISTKDGLRMKDEGRRTKPSSSPFVVQVELVRCRGGAAGARIALELDEQAGTWREATDHAAHPLPASAKLARPAPARRA
jgi:protein ImuA